VPSGISSNYTRALAAPELALPAISTTGQFTAYWSRVDGAERYVLQRDATGSDFAMAEEAFNGTQNNTPLNIDINGTFHFRVKGMNGTESGPWSVAKSIVIAIPPLGAPTLFAPESSGNGTYLITWTQVEGATGYDLRESQDPGFGLSVVAYSGGSNFFLVEGKADGAYYYRARALGANPGLWSDFVSVTVTLANPLGVPTLTVPSTSDTGTYTVRWSEVDGATGYGLQESTTSLFGGAEVVEVSGTSVLFTGKANGTYYYRVKAMNGTGSSDWSQTASVIVALDFAAEAVDVGVGGVTLLLHEGIAVDFSLDGERHTIVVLSTELNSAVVGISSTPQQVTLSTGETQELDLGSDGTADLSITLKSVSGSSASITLARTDEGGGGLPVTQIALVLMVSSAVLLLIAILWWRKGQQSR
jgi:hypothetical protein